MSDSSVGILASNLFFPTLARGWIGIEKEKATCPIEWERKACGQGGSIVKLNFAQEKRGNFFLIWGDEERERFMSGNIFLAFIHKLLYKFFRSLGLLEKRAYSPLFF